MGYETGPRRLHNVPRNKRPLAASSRVTSRMLAGVVVLLSLLLGLRAVAKPDATAAFDFSLSATAGLSVKQGEGVENTITARELTGAPEPVDFGIRGLPKGTTYLFSTATCKPGCASTLTILTSQATPAGRYIVEVTGFSAGVTRFASFRLTVAAAENPVKAMFSQVGRSVR